MKRSLTLIIFILSIMVSACQGAPGAQKPIQIKSYWVRAAALRANTAAYMVIQNTSSQEDHLIKAESIFANNVILMGMQEKNGVMQLVNQDSILVPAQGQVELKTGSVQVAFIGLRRELKDGDKIQLTLTFEKAGAIHLDVPVVTPDTEN